MQHGKKKIQFQFKNIHMACYLYVYSSIFTNQLYPSQVRVLPKPIPGALGTWWETSPSKSTMCLCSYNPKLFTVLENLKPTWT